ncbi:MAG: carboxypeptidase-like regulatory domain-containing protein, partial [Actinomycetia bacterium]|nr:carboxypeptidase-like regulatory domain-containing protein [Actinomycetes bacterium]
MTDATTGDPIEGATVAFTPGTKSATTDEDGLYSILLLVGDYTATATAFGYEPSDPASVTVTEDTTTTQDFALTPSATALLGGHVTDSGHGYGLYSHVVVSYNGSTVADEWTNLKGGYRFSLPAGTTYDITATPYLMGYTSGTATVTLNGDTRQNFSLEPDTSCGAPGYAYQFGEDFNGGTFPPAGWTVTNPVSGNTVWVLASSYANNNGNYTGGSGDAADADSNNTNISGDPYDTRLITPPIAVADVGTSPVVNFLENYIDIGNDDAADVDISTDGGATWTTVLHQTTDCGSLYGLPGCSKSLDLTSYLSGATSFQLRFRYYNLTGGWDWYWQVDDISIGTCEAIPGGLVIGSVSDANTGAPLVGTLLTDEEGRTTTTENVPGGLSGFVMFFPAGVHTLTATKTGYDPMSRHGGVANGDKIRVHYNLQAGELTLAPNPIVVNATVGTTTTVSLTVGNTGTAAA